MKSNAGPVIALATLALSACDPVAQAENESWVGQIDSLSSGEVVVLNLGAGLWPEGAGWRVVEGLRSGAVEAAGPGGFGTSSRRWKGASKRRDADRVSRQWRPLPSMGSSSST